MNGAFISGLGLGLLVGLIAGALCTVRAFLMMHKNALPPKHP